MVIVNGQFSAVASVYNVCTLNLNGFQSVERKAPGRKHYLLSQPTHHLHVHVVRFLLNHIAIMHLAFFKHHQYIEKQMYNT